uniref:Superoxide dismutase n=1 Tax=Amphora coffeiformis TaxID=265554 RepID=A0A7S3L5U4_9STRA
MTLGGKKVLDAALRAAVNVRSSALPSELSKTSAALFSAYGGAQHALPDLAYDYDALQPAISQETMTLHHSKHHNTYVTNLNAGLEKLDAAMTANNVSAIIGLQGALKFNGGGHLNHTLFWENLTPDETAPGPETTKAIAEAFGSLDALKADMSAKTVAVQGSGWGWLGYNAATKRLEIATCANQDPLQATTGLVPLLGIDVWEHAYYVDYRNVRPDYVKNIWSVIDWKAVEARLVAAK